mgnify:CR=1 FL=1
MHQVGWTLTVFFKLVDFQTNFRYNFIIILQYGGEKKLKKNVTLKDVAKLAGVSTAAASKALRGEKDIGPETRARVEKIAESLGYCTNNLAIYLRNGSIKALGVVMPDSFNPYNALVLQGVEEKAKELGYNVIIGNTNCDRALERDLLKSFVSMKVSGILAIPSWLENYKTIPVPLIIMSRFPYMEPYASKAHAILRPDVQYIVNDDFSGQYLAVEHLIQRGFRNNYLIIGSTEPDSAEGVMNLMRKDGYRKALADAGIAFAEDHVIENVRSIHESYRVVTQLLKSGAGRIGLCMNMDHLALAAISAAHDCGARIPEDIGLVGYDDIDSAKYMTPALTTISQSKYAIGAQSAIQVIEVLQVEPENIYAEEGLGLTDGDEVDHLDDLLRADGQWLYYGVEAENFFLIQWYPDEASAKAKLAQLEELGDGKQYLVDLSLRRSNPTEAENFGNSNPVQLRS